VKVQSRRATSPSSFASDISALRFTTRIVESVMASAEK
jgi:hypothetical protein